MIRAYAAPIAIAGWLLIGLNTASFAWGNNLTIKDGFGEEVTVRHGLFGSKQRVIKDRLGDGVAQKTGLFGTRETQVNLLGNQFRKKKGLFGGSEIDGSTIFGDKVTTKKGWFGRRTTTVDVSGMSAVIHDLMAGRKVGPTGPALGPGLLPPGAPVPVGPQDPGLSQPPAVDPGINPAPQ